jgi:endonuclease/exonuclease/phosphatase family metal-dependent hydrolase
MNPPLQLETSTPLSVIDRSSRQKSCQDTVEQKSTINQLDIIDTDGTLHPITAEYTFSSSSHGTFTKIDHIRGHKTHLNKFKRSEIVQNMFSDHSGIKIEINRKICSSK